MAQQLRSSSLGPQQRRTQPNCAFQTSKLLSIRVAPQTATPFVSSSSPAQIARPLSQPLRSTSNGKPTSPSPSPWAEARRRLLWFFGTRALAIAGIGLFCALYPPPPDRMPYLHMIVAFVLCDLAQRD